MQARRPSVPLANNNAIMCDSSAELPVSLKDVQEAAARVAPWVHTTPVRGHS